MCIGNVHVHVVKYLVRNKLTVFLFFCTEINRQINISRKGPFSAFSFRNGFFDLSHSMK